MRRLVVMIAGVALASCQEPPGASVPATLRVSAGHQLTSISSLTGSTAYAYDLVYLSLSRHVRIEDRSPDVAALVPRENSPYSARFLCEHLDNTAAAEHRVRGNACELRFTSAEEKRRRLSRVRIETGPYRVVREVPRETHPRGRCATDPGAPEPLLERIELRGDGSTAIDEIHIVSMPLHEQWRHLFARQIDVIPSTPIMYRSWFREMKSVRTVALPSSNALALYFNTGAPPWSQRDARRALVRALDMEAIARVACRERECRSADAFGVLDFRAWDRVLPPDAPVSLPEVVTIDVMSDDSSSVQAARVIRFQLRDRLGVDARVRRRCVTEFDTMLKHGEFGLLLMPLPQVELRGRPGDPARRWGGRAFIERLDIVAKYRNRALDEAVARAHRDRVEIIMQRDVPVVPLFQYLQFAAIDQRFCGPGPDSATSWRWLARLYPCDRAPGEAAEAQP